MRAATMQQEENNRSLEAQERICKEYAAKHGIIIKKQYRGTNERAKTEELYRKMITEVAADRDINVVLVSSLDRFTRDWVEATKTLLYLKSKGVFVIHTTQPAEPDGLNLLYNIVSNNVSSYEEE